MKFKYSREFIEKVKRAYPDNTEIHKLADNNNYLLGRYLDDGRGHITHKEVLQAESLEKIQDKAKQIEEREKLYSEWYRIVYVNPQN